MLPSAKRPNSKANRAKSSGFPFKAILFCTHFYDDVYFASPALWELLQTLLQHNSYWCLDGSIQDPYTFPSAHRCYITSLTLTEVSLLNRNMKSQRQILLPKANRREPLCLFLTILGFRTFSSLLPRRNKPNRPACLHAARYCWKTLLWATTKGKFPLNTEWVMCYSVSTKEPWVDALLRI